MKQQTAVEWLISKLKQSKDWQRVLNEVSQMSTVQFNLLEQAKAMENEQHDKTAEEWWKEGAHYMESGGKTKWESFEQYYNETFKSE